jgi:protein-S-isoprenylcysteine O-methyltransferase Ste14
MHGQPDRIEQFTAEISQLRVHDPSAPRDRIVARVGIVAMVVGVALGIFAFSHSNGTTNALQQRDAIVLGLLAVAVCTVGAALYVRAALAGFLRFWLLRDIHERRAQTDRLVAAAAPGGQEPEAPAANPTSMEVDR